MLRQGSTKTGYAEQVEAHKTTFANLKGRMEALYSVHSLTKDVDIKEDVRTNMQQLASSADSAATAYAGALKPIKLALAS